MPPSLGTMNPKPFSSFHDRSSPLWRIPLSYLVTLATSYLSGRYTVPEKRKQPVALVDPTPNYLPEPRHPVTRRRVVRSGGYRARFYPPQAPYFFQNQQNIFPRNFEDFLKGSIRDFDAVSRDLTRA